MKAEIGFLLTLMFATAFHNNWLADTVRSNLMPGPYGKIRGDPGPSRPLAGKSFILKSAISTTIQCLEYSCTSVEENTIVFVCFHGNLRSANKLDDMWLEIAKYGRVVAVNLPGYGDSSALPEGSPALQGSIPLRGMVTLELVMAANAHAVATYIQSQPNYDPSNTITIGRSLGSYSAIQVFKKLIGSHLLLWVPIGRFGDILPAFLGLPSRLGWIGAAINAMAFPTGLNDIRVPAYFTNGIDNIDALRNTTISPDSQVLVIGGAQDALISPDTAECLREALGGKAEVVLVSGGHRLLIWDDGRGRDILSTEGLYGFEEFVKRIRKHVSKFD